MSDSRPLCLGSHVLFFPLAAGIDLAMTTLDDLIGIRSPVDLALLDQSFLDERVEVRVEPSVMDFGLVVVFEFVFECEAVWFVLSGGGVQQIALEASQIVHIQQLVIPTVKYIDMKTRSSAVEPDSEIARLDSLAVIVAGSPCRIRKQVRDFAIESVIEIR